MYMANIDGTTESISQQKYHDPVPESLRLPAGIAVDKARGRVYISNGAASTISVDSTAGASLHTIQ